MAGLWDIGDSKLDEDPSDELMEKHEDEFRPAFDENMAEDVPTHPYKVYRSIVEDQDLSDEQKIVLRELKEEYSDKWMEMKRGGR